MAHPAADLPGTDAVVQQFEGQLAAGAVQPPTLRQALSDADTRLFERFRNGDSASSLVRLRAELVDRLILALWRHHGLDAADDVALVAVAGYGRGDLNPHSDVDILVLLAGELPDAHEAALSTFMTDLWDVGLEIGHSVRTVQQCRDEAEKDLTVATSLMESRLLQGSGSLYDAMNAAISTAHIWPSAEFFAEKRKEQIARHHRYDDTAYKLEPNVKGSPGGLRDIQMIGWVAKRHFGADTLDELVEHRFLTPGQLTRLLNGQEFLWRVRYGLHMLTGRREDRLLFDHQTKLAALLGYEDATFTLAVEQLMQRYYRTVMDLSRLNEMLLQLFEEAILMDPSADPVALNDRFQVKNGYLQTADDNVFARDPSALLELFLLLQENSEIRGVSAWTVGLIKRNLSLIDDEFRQNPRNHRLFLKILRANEGVTHQLRRMNLYGVLGLYIPAFGRIVGRMQYDLFHAYTVDEHTLFVVSNLRRFALPRFDAEYPQCSRLMQSLEKPEIVYLAGLFHDIAKGRGGDHSELGAVDAEAFCLEHGMSEYEARTVAWLVRHHLALSMTAQKKDISDPDVINEFAELVGDQSHLDYLYLLTVADVRGTNPQLWNSWKATLFHDLYGHTTRALRSGHENPIDREQLILETQNEARDLLLATDLSADHVAELWQLFPEDYFLRYRPGEIAWHTEILADSDPASEYGFLDVRRQRNGDGMEAVLYTPRQKRTFALTTALLDELGMTIVDARIVPLAVPFSIDMYVFMETDSKIDVDDVRINKVRRVLTRVLTTPDDGEVRVTRRVSRQARMFSARPSVRFTEDVAGRRTVMEINALDRPGLLSLVGQVFIELDINIDTAKIVTIGERAEDVFYIFDHAGEPLSEALCETLGDRLIERLELQT
ncbi:MAG: [protein-PII] uridylyltransferase [Pseudomonadota bacterium]